MNYKQFVEAKLVRPSLYGREVQDSDIHSSLFGHQRHIVRWAMRLGRAAIFADTGLGKTRMQLEWARLTGQRALILTPLAVGPQTVREAAAIGIDAGFCREEPDASARIVVANYESLHKFDCGAYGAVVLDESSILKSVFGKTKRLIIEAFAATPWKLACTATPAPNDHMELGNHAEFVGAMRAQEMLTRWFTHDSGDTSQWRLKGHAESDFWRWVSSWASMVSMPSDIGFSDAGYVLPPLEICHHVVTVDVEPDAATGQLIPHTTLSATTLHKEMRRTAPRRAQAVADAVNASAESWLVWCNTNYESDELLALIPGAEEIRGSDSDAKKESAFSRFESGSLRVLITKPSIAGFGLNWQHCARMAFVGLSYSYEQLYQAIRRCWRFGQKRPVEAHIFSAQTEGTVAAAIAAKRKDHEKMREKMREFAGAAAPESVVQWTEETRQQGNGWTIYNGDCVEVSAGMPDNSIDLSVFSPPFANLYIYSSDPRDMGNTADEAHFIEQFRFMVRELHRITRPGRLAVVHCKDSPRFKGKHGAAGFHDLSGDIIRAFDAEGWQYHSRVTIWKDPVTEMQRTKSNGLLYMQLCKDSSASRQAMADYLVVFRKIEGIEGPEVQPVTAGGERFSEYVGSNAPVATSDPRKFAIDVWQRYASAVWFDIDQSNVLNGKAATENEDERHICPLQLDVIERCIHLWSNPGDVVFSPFAGIGSEGVVALKLRRQFVGIELKPAYFRHAVRNLQGAVTTQLSLFGD